MYPGEEDGEESTMKMAMNTTYGRGGTRRPRLGLCLSLTSHGSGAEVEGEIREGVDISALHCDIHFFFIAVLLAQSSTPHQCSPPPSSSVTFVPLLFHLSLP